MVGNVLSTCDPKGKEKREFCFNKAKTAGGTELPWVVPEGVKEVGTGARDRYSHAICRCTLTRKPVSPKMNSAFLQYRGISMAKRYCLIIQHVH